MFSRNQLRLHLNKVPTDQIATDGKLLSTDGVDRELWTPIVQSCRKLSEWRFNINERRGRRPRGGYRPAVQARESGAAEVGATAFGRNVDALE